jgi:Abi-like protein
MTIIDFERTVSQERFEKYVRACSGDTDKAHELYNLNIRLAKEFYSVLGIFEIALRNAIHRHYTNIYGTPSWIQNEVIAIWATNPHYIVSMNKTVQRLQEMFAELQRKKPNRYSAADVIATCTFGTWVHFFSPELFRLGQQTAHRIFPRRAKGTTQRQIHKDLLTILRFRNRVAHHESLCFFAKAIDTISARNILANVEQYTRWLDIDVAIYGTDLTKIAVIAAQIDVLKTALIAHP